ncbi:MAG: Ppx/GppA family phosphatase [Myxococcales bacterium]|nr:Ppx/GppA family phosphatase [Myxococcales bacterium]MCB9519755.1 Ppx/GppA family phosphatase [Myxococcales bacterium]MCB9533694.1 Ppx/GppA family phosphatase [Myxococcales bacterium]
MKLAAIDIGSNSIHMIVAEIDGEGNFAIIDRQKEMARLGERSLSDGALTPEAMQRGIDALTNFKRVADGYRVADVIGVATSAVRESRNGQEFIDRVREECGIDARIIEGIEEGRLIYLGAREVFDFGGRRALIVDIGGGSVEFILADRRREYIVHSLKLGVRRLHEQFLPSDPPTAAELDALRSHVRSKVEFVVRAVRKRGFDLVLGTSGTARALARATAARTGGSDVTVPRRDLAATVAAFAAVTADERGSLPGVDDKRRDAILEGGVLLQTILESFGGDAFTYCDAALREGMIIDYLERNRPGLRMMDAIPDPRRRAVLLFARRLTPNFAHVEQVARLATRLFDELAPLHGLGAPARDLLEYAALLHDVGHAIGGSAHHKHTLYIVQNAELAGFSERERLIVANIARYHRRSVPRPRHPEFERLDKPDRDLVIALSTLLRVANALDRGHYGNVHSIACSIEPDTVRVRIGAQVEPDVEVRAAESKSHHFEQLWNRRLIVEAAPLDPTPRWDERVD